MLVSRAPAMAFVLGVASGGAGCNQLFGLDPPRTGDAALDDDGGGDPVDADADGDGRSADTAEVVFGTSIDVISPAGPVHGYEAHAAFEPVEDCALVVTAGGCRVERCTPRVPTMRPPGSGTVTIEGNGRLVDLVPDVTGRYLPQAGTDGILYDPGITVGVYSTGGVVPAFSATLVAPAIIRFTDPPLPSPTSPASAVRSAGMELAWEPAVAGEVLLLVGDADGGRLTCRFPASTGRDTVPGAVLTELSSGDASLFAFTIASDHVTAGAFDFTVVVAQAARRSDSDRARGTLMLQ